MAGHECMNIPLEASGCDHGEQMIPPVAALGSRSAGVMYRPRVPTETSTFWRLVGVVDETQLSYSSDVGGPPTLDRGQSVTFQTGTPFVASSQDADHPFMLFAYMTSTTFVSDGDGDPDFVLAVPAAQYVEDSVFFTDPTYPEANIVVVRNRGLDGDFHDVVLDCAGAIQGWRSITSDLEYARSDLMTSNFMPIGACSTGVHRIHSGAPFGITVWGWGTLATATPGASYGFPGGMDVKPINPVVLSRSRTSVHPGLRARKLGRGPDLNKWNGINIATGLALTGS